MIGLLSQEVGEPNHTWSVNTQGLTEASDVISSLEGELCQWQDHHARLNDCSMVTSAWVTRSVVARCCDARESSKQETGHCWPTGGRM